VIVSPSAEAQGFLDEVTGGDVDLPPSLAPRPAHLGDPVLEAIGLRRAPGAATADVAEFGVAFDGNDGTAAEEKAEDDLTVGSIADWVRETPAPSPPKPPASRASAKTAQPRVAMKTTGDDTRPAIDDHHGGEETQFSSSTEAAWRPWSARGPHTRPYRTGLVHLRAHNHVPAAELRHVERDARQYAITVSRAVHANICPASTSP